MSHDRRQRLAFVPLLLAVAVIASGLVCTCRPSLATDVASLKDQLEKGLRATRPDQLELINKVVDVVEQEQLPRRMVNAAFKWSRERRPSYPYPFFVRALRVLASREGIKL